MDNVSLGRLISYDYDIDEYAVVSSAILDKDYIEKESKYRLIK
ncbi:hypothetical protein [Clostridium tertium]|nr:hypothetical protein [Clostridium tertium]MBP1867344.1 hypothetical protein [Clostridium tertium]